MVDASRRAASQTVDAISTGASELSGQLSNLANQSPDLSGRAKDTLARFSTTSGSFADNAIAAAQKLLSTVGGAVGRAAFSKEGEDRAVYAAAAAAAAVAGAAVIVRGVGTGANGEGKIAAEGDPDRSTEVDRPLQTIGVSKEAAAAVAREGERDRD